MVTEFIKSHFPVRSVSYCQRYPSWPHHKPLSTRETEIERLEKVRTEDTEVKNTDANVGNGQKVVYDIYEDNTKDHNRVRVSENG